MPKINTKKDNDKDISLLDCYDAWMDHQMNSFVTKGKKWVEDVIEKIKKAWKPAESKEDAPQEHENYEVVVENLDLLQKEADDAIEMSNFNLDLDDTPVAQMEVWIPQMIDAR